MTELRDALEVVQAIEDCDSYALWAPGDATVYRVALLRAVLSSPVAALEAVQDLTALVIVVGRTGPSHALVVTKPVTDQVNWNASRFWYSYGPRYAGWWAGVRPLLAALGWTDRESSDLAYDPTNTSDIRLIEIQGSQR